MKKRTKTLTPLMQTDIDRQINIGKIIVERHHSQLPYINPSDSSGQQEQLKNTTNLT